MTGSILRILGRGSYEVFIHTSGNILVSDGADTMVRW